MQFETLKWVGQTDGYLELIDQRLLPGQFEKLQCRTVPQLFEAIQTLAVRGAPAIGVSAAYGVCLAAQKLSRDITPEKAFEEINAACDYLASSRPTAVNLFWALDRMRQKGREFVLQNPTESIESLKQSLLKEAHAICDEDKAMCEAIGVMGSLPTATPHKCRRCRS